LIKPEIDRVLFSTSLILLLLVGAPMVLTPVQTAEFVAQLYDWIAGELGLFYQWLTLGSTIVLTILAFGKYGQRRLGGEHTRPDYSNLSWMSMLFCAGIGAGLLYWSTIEWASYLDTPPFGLEPGSGEAREWAATYGIFHWGLSAWCLYCLPTVAIAYPYYERNIPYLRLSTSLSGLFGDDIVNRPLGRLVDFVFIIALIGGTGTSLGLATPMIAACVSALFGLNESFAIDVSVVVIAVMLFAFSVYLGLEKGIKRFSDVNVVLAGIFVVFVLVSGPTMFVLKLGTNSLGLMVQEFIRLNTWTDPVMNTGFVEDWSIFYWAWWLAYGPFMGLFVTRISRGRTLKQLILGMVGFGTLGCAIFYITIGNTAMWMDMEGIVPVRELVAAGHGDTAIAQVMSALPLQPLPLIVFIVVALIFVATTYDSASYAIAASATRNLTAGSNPARWHRVFWAFALGVLPVMLMFVGGLKAIQSVVLVVSLPVLVIGVAMTVSLFKSLRHREVVDHV
jgi:BCCT family betaine/carnitine transporter